MARLRDIIAGRAARRNPVSLSEYTAGPKIVLYVGRYVGGSLGVSPKDVTATVRALLRDLGMYEGMTVFPAQGVYTHDDGHVVSEPTMVITLLCPTSMTYAVAAKRAGVLALNLAALYEQEAVLAEVLDGDGTHRHVYTATCDGDLDCVAVKKARHHIVMPMHALPERSGRKRVRR
jgi:hypothetical protein